MKVLQSALVFLIIVVIAALLVPMDLRTAYWNYGAAWVQQHTGDPNGAVDHFKYAFEALPDDVTFARAYLSQLNDNGKNFNQTVSFAEAERVATNWINDHPDDPQVWQIYIERARSFYGRNRFAEAKTDIDKAVNLEPGDYIALIYKGIIYRDMHPNDRNRIREAIPFFETAIQIRSEKNTYWAHFEMAKAYNMIGDDVHALNEVNQTLSQFPPRWLRDEAERLKNDIQSSGRTIR
jgi:tetratricopeptide (TPR) repeat protein